MFTFQVVRRINSFFFLFVFKPLFRNNKRSGRREISREISIGYSDKNSCYAQFSVNDVTGILEICNVQRQIRKFELEFYNCATDMEKLVVVGVSLSLVD